MMGWKSRMAAAVVVVLSLAMAFPSPARAAQSAGAHPATGVGSCALKNWNPKLDPEDAKDLPQGQRPQTYKQDCYDCTGATFAAPGVEFTRFPQPNSFQVNNQQTFRQLRTVWQPAQATNPLGSYFPPFTHFVILYRENH